MRIIIPFIYVYQYTQILNEEYCPCCGSILDNIQYQLDLKGLKHHCNDNNKDNNKNISNSNNSNNKIKKKHNDKKKMEEYTNNQKLNRN